MPADKTMRDVIDSLVACDEQPSEDRLATFRQALEHKVTHMKRKGRSAQVVFFAGIGLMALGFAVTAIAANRQPSIAWLTATGFSLAIGGAAVVLVGSIGLFLYRGFGYVWARHDWQEAAIWELSLQVQRLSQRVDEVAKRP